MDPVSAAPVLIEEDLKLTAYRLEVARSMPQDPYRDALILGLGARLSSLSREAGSFPGVNRDAART
jgi:hypothetical protein